MSQHPENLGSVAADANPTALAQMVVDQSEERLQAARIDEEVVLPEDALARHPRGTHGLSRRLAAGRLTKFIVLAIIVTLDNLQGSGLSTLAPNIQSSLHVSSGTIMFVAGVSGGFLVLGIVPMGWLADRYRRPPIIGMATVVFGVMVFFTGLAINIFVFFLARFGAGISQASTSTVHGSLLADAYPISLRGRIYAAMGMATGLAGALSPLLVGAIATAFGVNGWRWAFYILSLPIVLVAVFAFFVPEPPRGQYEKMDVLGEVVDTNPVPPSLEAAFERIMRIRTMKTCLIAFSAIGFGLFTAPVLGNLFLQQHFAWMCFSVGSSAPSAGIGVIAVLPFAGRYYDRLYHEDPAQALSLIGKVLLPVAVLVPIQYFMPNAVLWAVFSVIVLDSAHVRVLHDRSRHHLGGSVSPPRHDRRGGRDLRLLRRSHRRGHAGGRPRQAFGPRAAVLIIMIPSTIFGAIMIIRSAISSATTSRLSWWSSRRSRRRTVARRPIPSRSRSCSSITSTSATGTSRSSSASTSRCNAARCWRCSGQTAPASRPHSEWRPD